MNQLATSLDDAREWFARAPLREHAACTALRRAFALGKPFDFGRYEELQRKYAPLLRFAD